MDVAPSVTLCAVDLVRSRGGEPQAADSGDIFSSCMAARDVGSASERSAGTAL